MKQSKSLHAQVKVAARSSRLSRCQVEEVFSELKQKDIDLVFESTYLQSSGDLDQITSLKMMEKTDFFTKEIDALVLSGEVDIAIHSAKDLPDPLHPDLEIIAVTKGKDPADSLVMRSPYTILTLPYGSIIGTSSLRREENLKAIRPDFQFLDIRGTIDERLVLFEQKKIDALVVAEAALLRLGYEQLHREVIPGPVALYQGQLAILARKENISLAKVFAAIDSRVHC